MRKRERERKKNQQRRRNNEKAFSEHSQEGGVFGTSRRAGRWCRGRRGRVSRVVRGGSRSRRRDVVVLIH